MSDISVAKWSWQLTSGHAAVVLIPALDASVFDQLILLLFSPQIIIFKVFWPFLMLSLPLRANTFGDNPEDAFLRKHLLRCIKTNP